MAIVTIEDEKFVHESISTYFTIQGAIKKHRQIVGVPWDDSIDDYA